MIKLVLKKKAEIISEFRINKKKVISIGSAKGNNIIIKDKNISEYHCTITKEKEKYLLKDNNTLFGTRIIPSHIEESLQPNDSKGRLITLHELQDADVIDLGIYSLQFCYETDKKVSKEKKREKTVPSDMSNAESKISEKISQIKYFLLGIYGKFECKKYELKIGETYLGRKDTNPKGIDNDIVFVDDMTCSKGHAKISYINGQYILTDTGSTGGTAINGEKVGQFNNVVIKPKDEITIGRNIFRVVEDGDEDYSTPKKHKILLLKLKRPFYITATIVVLLCALVAIYRGIAGVSVIKNKPKKLDVYSNYARSPQGNIAKLVLPPYDISSSPCIGDLNNDSINDIAFLNSSGSLFAWDGLKEKLLWKPMEIPNSGIGSPAIADVNNDGVNDIICLSNTSMVYVIDGQTGGIVFRDVLGGTISELSPTIADLNLDGKSDIVVCAEEGMVYFIYSAGFSSEVEKITDFIEGPIYSSPIVIATEKISPIVVVCSNNSKVFLIDGKTRDKRTVDLVEKTKKAHLIASAPGIGDLDGDGMPEIIVQSNMPQYVSAIDINRSEVNWTYFVEPIPPAGLKHTSSPVIIDIDNDGLLDVVVFSANGMVYALKGKTEYPAGELLWKVKIPGSNRIISSPSIYDFNKDGMLDMIFGTEDGNVYILGNSISDGGGEFLFKDKISDTPITSSILIGDIKSDAYLDIICSNTVDVLKIIPTNLKVFKNKIYWSMYLGDASRAKLSHKEDITPYNNSIGIGISVCLLLLITNILLKRKKIAKRSKTVSL
ncbi:MAG: FG-GAP-like repeat-containing protein [Elusimicrobiota bacterium]